MYISFLQFKPEFGNVSYNIDRIQVLLSKYLKESAIKPDLMVIPELANSGYLFSGFDELEATSETAGEGEFYNSLQKISSENGINFVAGFNEKSGKDFYNSAYIIRPDGSFDVYRKIHLTVVLMFIEKFIYSMKKKNGLNPEISPEFIR